MNLLLTKFLKKIGKEYEELNTAEKTTYKNWERQLAETGKPITIGGLIKFLEKEIESEIAQLCVSNIKLNDPTDVFLKGDIKRNRMLLAFLLSPEKGRDVLREYLEKKLDNIKADK